MPCGSVITSLDTVEFEALYTNWKNLTLDKCVYGILIGC